MIRRFLPLLLLAVLAAPVAHAQTTSTITCTGTPSASATCSDSSGLGALVLAPDGAGNQSTLTYDPAYPSSGVNPLNTMIVGGQNSWTLTNSTSSASYGSGALFGWRNTLNTLGIDITISGSNNNVTDTGGLLTISGSGNSLTSSDTYLTISGSENTVTGTVGKNQGLTISGSGNAVDRSSGVVSGTNNTITNSQSTAVQGTGNIEKNSTVSSITGYGNTLTTSWGVSIDGYGNTVSGNYGAVSGSGNHITGDQNFVTGMNNQSSVSQGLISGSGNVLQVQNGAIFGNGNTLGPDAQNTTVIANDGNTDRANTVYFGSRTLSGVQAGVMMDDAATMAQLNQGLSYLGGGASFNFSTGQFTAPSYVLSGGTYNDVYSALLYLDSKPSGSGSQGPQGPQGPAGKDGKDGSGSNVVAGKNIRVTKDANGDAVVATSDTPTFSTVTTTDGAGNTSTTSGNGVTITLAAGNAVSLTGQGLDNGGNVIDGVAAGQVTAHSLQAINGAQLFQFKQDAKSYTDTQVAAAKNWAKSYTDMRIDQLNDRFDRIAAVGQASASMASNFRELPNSYAVGLGWAGGHNAVAVGYRHISEDGHLSWSVAGSISGSERTVGVGFGYGW